MGFLGWVLGYLWLLCALYLLGKATGWILRGGFAVIIEAFLGLGRYLIFVYWELPLRVITGRPVHAKVLSKIEKLENDLGYRGEWLESDDPMGKRHFGYPDDVIWFQRAHGLVPDGVLGPKTLAVCKMIDNKRKIAAQMINTNDYAQTEMIVCSDLVEAARNFHLDIGRSPADRQDLDRARLMAYQTKIDVQLDAQRASSRPTSSVEYGRTRRNGS